MLARAASYGGGTRKGSGRVDDRKSREHAAATAHHVTTGRVLTLFCHRPAPIPVLAQLSNRAARLEHTPPPRPPHAARPRVFCEMDGWGERRVLGGRIYRPGTHVLGPRLAG